MGSDAVIDAPDRLLVYESDGLTAYRQRPDAVVLPGSRTEAIAVVRSLAQAGVPMVPRGAGTGLSGGALAGPGSIIIGTARLNRVLSMDAEARIARVEPGLINALLSVAAGAHGLYYAPDPSSQSACSLGGNLAENSGGPHCLKYGVTSRYVSGMTMVLPTGEVVELGGAGREPDPFDLRGVTVGSEGCFGLVTEIEVRLLPLPDDVRTLLAIFDELEAAGHAVTDIMAQGLLPAALEIIDGETIRAVESSVFAAGYPTDAAAALVIEFDGLAHGLDDDVEAAVRCCESAGAREVRTAESDEERAALWRGRKKAFGAMGRIAPDLLVQDATVPRTRLPAVLGQIAEIGERYQLNIANVFHAGDGNLHPNILFDRRDTNELDRVERASKEIMAVCVEAGGTITGEHGVGLDKRQYMEMVYDAATLQTMAAVRRVFDPELRCNPGKVLPDHYWQGDGWQREGEVDAPVASFPGDPVDPPSSAPLMAPAMPQMRSTGSFDPARLLGADQVISGEATAEWSIAAANPAQVVFPRSEEEVVAVMRRAAEAGWTVVPAGTGRRLDLRGDRSTPELVLSLRDLSGVVRYDAADLTIIAKAGTSLSQLRSTLAAEGQLLPLDSVGPGDGTLGGAVALGWSGALQAAFGAPRDQLLGLRAVRGDAILIAPGGRVVKNVAGFDLTRLLVGSGGHLAVITEASLRVYPIPPMTRVLEVRGGGVPQLLTQYLAAAATGAPILSSAVVHGWEGEAILRIELGGRPAAVSEGVRRIHAALPESEIGEGSEANGWAMIPPATTAPLILRVHAIRTRLADGVGAALARLGSAIGSGGWTVGADICGCSSVTFPEAEESRVSVSEQGFTSRTLEDWVIVVDALAMELSRVGAALSVARAPAALWQLLGDRGGVGEVRRLTEGVRFAFDPSGVLGGKRDHGDTRGQEPTDLMGNRT